MATATTFKAVADRATGNLNAGVDNVVTTWDLQAGQGASFPDPAADGDFWVTSENEQALCTARVADALTVTRGANGTTAAAHAGGVGVELRVIAQQVTDIQTAVNSVEARVGNNDAVFTVPAVQTAIASTPSGALTDAAGLVGRFTVRERIVFRYWSYRVGSGGTANAVVRAAVYSSDGATKLMDDEHSVGASTGEQTVDLGAGSEVTLEPGDYYFFICLSSGTTGPTVYVWNTSAVELVNTNVPSGQPVFEGSTGVAGGIAPGSVDTAVDISGAADSTVFGRLDA